MKIPRNGLTVDFQVYNVAGVWDFFSQSLNWKCRASAADNFSARLLGFTDKPWAVAAQTQLFWFALLRVD